MLTHGARPYFTWDSLQPNAKAAKAKRGVCYFSTAVWSPLGGKSFGPGRKGRPRNTQCGGRFCRTQSPESKKRPRLHEGSYAELKLEAQIDRTVRIYFDLAGRRRNGLRALYEDAQVTELFDALMDGQTLVGEQEPLRVNLALERLLQHLVVDTTITDEVGFWEIEGFMNN